MTIIRYSIGIALAVLVGLSAYAFEYVWYRNTSYLELNAPAFKAQETAYPGRPKMTISTEGLEKTVVSRLASRDLVNPVLPTAASLSAGKSSYMTYCSPCHGESGDGKGLMGSVPAMTVVEQDNEDAISLYLEGYTEDELDIDINYVQTDTDGEIFYTITEGGEGIMPAFRDALNPRDRWNLINYIKVGLGAASGR